jgi:hypothetical protein
VFRNNDLTERIFNKILKKTDGCIFGGVDPKKKNFLGILEGKSGSKSYFNVLMREIGHFGADYLTFYTNRHIISCT